jgi:hypothetical protein
VKKQLAFILLLLSYPALAAERPFFFDDSINGLLLNNAESGKAELQGSVLALLLLHQ